MRRSAKTCFAWRTSCRQFRLKASRRPPMRVAVKACSRRCRRPWRCFASTVCRSAFHAATPLRMRALLRLKNTSIGLSTRAHCSPGFSRSCLLATVRRPILFPTPLSASICTTSCARCARRSPCSRSTSKTTANSSAAALPAGVATCTSMPRAMWSRACSRTIRTRTSMM